MQVTVGAGVLHPYIQGTVFAPSTFIFDLKMHCFPWKYHVQYGQGSSRDPVPQEGLVMFSFLTTLLPFSF